MRKTVKKSIGIFLLITFILSAMTFAGCGNEKSSSVSNMEEKTIPIYYGDIEHTGELTLNYFDGIEDIPYICLEEIAKLLNGLYSAFHESAYNVATETDGGAYALIRENGSAVYLSPATQRITFSQVGDFNMDPDHASNILDIVLTGGTDPDSNLFLHRKNAVRTAAPYMIELEKYYIEMKEGNGTVYIPLQTVSDLFLSPIETCAAYNGKIVACTSGGLSDEMGPKGELGELFYDCERGQRSDDLAFFCYNELCLGLDFNYGLKEKHHITDFSTFFAETGLTEQLMSNDPLVFDYAISSLCNLYFGDLHSAFGSVSPLLEPTTSTISQELFSYDLMSYMNNALIVNEGRREFYGKPTEVPAYEEVGNTAYITFDVFTMDTDRDYYSADLSEAADYTCSNADTVLLLCYANQQIHRENSPIENVVIDLRCNGGGFLDAAMAVCSWFLGTSCLHLEDAIDGAQASTCYQFDANLDHVFNSTTDCVNGLNMNRFCLISPASFSCGNLVPALFKSNGLVTLIGQRSGGGACAVGTMSLADGTIFNCSSRYRISTSINGSYYDVDQGVDPHYTLPDMSQYYDREKLTEYINGLLWK